MKEISQEKTPFSGSPLRTCSSKLKEYPRKRTVWDRETGPRLPGREAQAAGKASPEQKLAARMRARC